MAKKPNKPEPIRDERAMACAAQHFGPWMVEPQWFTQAVNAVKAGTYKAERVIEKKEDGGTRTLYDLRNGVAIIQIVGQITKGESSFGGASSVATRRSIRQAVNDDRVEAILINIDSPGGTVAGTADLAADVREAASIKPTHAFIEDLGASAAYWIASQTGHIAANSTALIGSIGTVAVVEDTSGAYDKAGIKVHVVSTGKHKGAFTDGAPVTDEQLAELQAMVDGLNEHFLAAVMEGRGMNRDELNEIADGRVFIADKALSLGLIDTVSSFDAAFEALSMESSKMDKSKFDTLKAENPTWIAAEVEQAKRAGHAEARTELKTFLAAFPDNPRFAAEQFAAGRTIDEAKATADEIAKATAAKDAEIKDQAAEIERLKAKAGGQAAVATGADAGTAVDPATITDPKARAAAEWDANTSECQNKFSSKDRYVAIRSAELTGKHRTK